MNSLLYIVVGIIIGILIGILLGKHTPKTDGLFIVNDSDFEKTQWIIDVNTDPKDIPNKKEVRLKVKMMKDDEVV